MSVVLAWSANGFADVATLAVEQVNVPQLHRLTGRVEAVNQATMTAQTSGRIAQMYVDVNDMVNKGEPLARLKNEQQTADVNLATAGLAEARAEAERAQNDLNRLSDLFKRQLVAKAALEQSQAAQKTAEARLKAAQARVSSAEENYQFTLIRAPYAGIVTRRHVAVGESVRPGSPLVSGISLNQLRVVVDVPQSLVTAVRSQKKALVEVADGKQILSEKITVFPYADELTHGFTARIELPEGVADLFPGMLVSVNIMNGEVSALRVPATSVVQRGELSAVYVKQPDGRISLRQVRHGRMENGQQIIHAGLAAGEQVFIDPQAAVVALKQQPLAAHE